MEDTNWRDFAQCKGCNTTDFFPASINRSTKKTVDKIVSMCIECPVGAFCLQEALITESLGIWALTTHFQRNAYLKQRNSSSPITLEECQVYFDYIKENKVYPNTRHYKKAITHIANTNE